MRIRDLKREEEYRQSVKSKKLVLKIIRLEKRKIEKERIKSLHNKLTAEYQKIQF